MRALLVFLMFCVSFLFGCGRPASDMELVGTYEADYEIAKERLTLNNDGTFIHEVVLKSTSKVDVSRGKWSYDPSHGYVDFDENFMSVIDGFHQLNPDYAHAKKARLYSTPVGKLFGRINFGTDERVLYWKVRASKGGVGTGQAK